jgi:hypothetical protein
VPAAVPPAGEGLAELPAAPTWTPVQPLPHEGVAGDEPAAPLSVAQRLSGPTAAAPPPAPVEEDGSAPPSRPSAVEAVPALAAAGAPAVAALGNRPLVALRAGPPRAGERGGRPLVALSAGPPSPGPGPAQPPAASAWTQVQPLRTEHVSRDEPAALPSVAQHLPTPSAAAPAVAALGERPIVLRAPAAWAPDASLGAVPPGGQGAGTPVSVPAQAGAGRSAAVDAGARSAVAVAQRTTVSAGGPPWAAERSAGTTAAPTTGAGAPFLRVLAPPADVGGTRGQQRIPAAQPLPPVVRSAEVAAHPGPTDARAWDLLVLRQDTPAAAGAGTSEPAHTGTPGPVGAPEQAPPPEARPAEDTAGLPPAGASVQALATPPAPGAPGPGVPASTSPTDIDALVQRLFDPLVRLLKAELRLDRERVGHALDLRY